MDNEYTHLLDDPNLFPECRQNIIDTGHPFISKEHIESFRIAVDNAIIEQLIKSCEAGEVNLDNFMENHLRVH